MKSKSFSSEFYVNVKNNLPDIKTDYEVFKEKDKLDELRNIIIQNIIDNNIPNGYNLNEYINYEIDKYLGNLEEILDFANIVNNAPVEGLDVTIGANEAKNVFRKDEIKVFEDRDALLQNAPEKEQNMFKIPKVIN